MYCCLWCLSLVFVFCVCFVVFVFCVFSLRFLCLFSGCDITSVWRYLFVFAFYALLLSCLVSSRVVFCVSVWSFVLSCLALRCVVSVALCVCVFVLSSALCCHDLVGFHMCLVGCELCVSCLVLLIDWNFPRTHLVVARSR